MEADKVNDTLIRLGDIAAGLSIPIGDLAYLYGTTMVQGRLYTQDLNQFMGRGIPIADELAKQFGVTTSEVKELVTAGKIGFPEVEKAIVSLTGNGSKFGGLMEAQSKTISGQISNLEDSIATMFNEMGKSTQGVIGTTISAANALVENWQKVVPAIAAVVTAIGSYKAAILVTRGLSMASHFVTLSKAAIAAATGTGTLTKAMHAFNIATKMNPIGLVVSGLATATVAFLAFKNRTKEANDEQERTISIYDKAQESISTEGRELSYYFDKLKKAKEGTEQYQAAKQTIIDKYGDYLQGLTDEQKALADIEGAYIAINNAIREKYKLEAAENEKKQVFEAFANSTKPITESIISVLKRQGNTEDVATDAAYSIINAFENKSKADRFLVNVYFNAFVDLIEAAGVGLGTIGDAGGTIRTLLSQYNTKLNRSDDQIEKIDKKYGIGTKGATEGTGTTGTGTPAPDKEAEAEAKRLHEAALARIKQREENARKEAEAARARQLEINGATIEAMDEGLKQQTAKIEHDGDLLKEANRKRANDMLAAAGADALLAWEDKNPKASTAAKTKKETQIAADYYIAPDEWTGVDEVILKTKGLAEQQIEQLKAFEQNAANATAKATEDFFTGVLEQYATYEAERQKIEAAAAEKRSILTNADGSLKIGATQENIDNINADEAAKIDELDSKVFESSEAYQEFCEVVAERSIEKLMELMDKATSELSKIEKAGGSKSKEAAIQKQQIKGLTNELKALQKERGKTKISPDEQAKRDWDELKTHIGKCGSALREIGSIFGGTVADITNTAATIADSTVGIIDGITTLTQSSAAAMTSTSAAASEAIKSVERASVILAIIGLVLKIANAIADAVKKALAAAEAKKIEELKQQASELEQFIENNNQTLERQFNFYVSSLGKTGYSMTQVFGDFVKNYIWERQQLDRELKEASKDFKTYSFFGMDGKADEISNFINSLKDKLAVLAEDFKKKIREAIREITGKLGAANLWPDLTTQLFNFEKDTKLIAENIALYLQDAAKWYELYSTATDEESKEAALKKYQEALKAADDLTQQLIDKKREIFESFGLDASNIATQIGDALFDAFARGEDAARAWKETTQELVADLVKNMINQKVLLPAINQLTDKFFNSVFTQNNNGGFLFNGGEAVTTAIIEFATGLEGLNETLIPQIESLFNQFEGAGILADYFGNERGAGQRGIATASQESIDVLNGRMAYISESVTAIRWLNTSIAASVGAIMQDVDSIRYVAENINRSTTSMNNTLQSLDGRVRNIEQTISQ